MKQMPVFVSAVVAAVLAFSGCDGEGPATRPGPGPEQGAVPTLPEKLIQVTARIDPTAAVEGFPKTLVVDLVPDPGQDLHWNNEAPLPTVTLVVPDGVRLSQDTAVMPNTSVPDDAASRSARVGLAEDAAAGSAWRLRVSLKAYVCQKHTGVCLIAEEAHEVTPARAASGS